MYVNGLKDTKQSKIKEKLELHNVYDMLPYVYTEKNSVNITFVPLFVNGIKVGI